MRLGNTRLTLAISIAICYGIQLTQAQNYKVIVATDGHEAGNSDDKLYRYDSSGNRSEVHTSELQSLVHLVCRLLLEQKNNH